MSDDVTSSDDDTPADLTKSERRCLVRRIAQPKDGMIRFVVGPDETIVPDVDERLPGRGFWLSADRDVVHTACTKNAFAKAARRRVTIPPDMPELLERLLVRRCQRTLGLARRAGVLVAGFEKVKERLRLGCVGLLFEAQDGAASGRAKVSALGSGIPMRNVLSGTELGYALGRDHVVHVAVDKGRFSETLMRDAARLTGFRKPTEEKESGNEQRADSWKSGEI